MWWKIQTINAQYNAKIHTIRFDGETLLTQECQNITVEYIILCQILSPKIPEQNGLAEHWRGVLIMKARVMAFEASLPRNI